MVTKEKEPREEKNIKVIKVIKESVEVIKGFNQQMLWGNLTIRQIKHVNAFFWDAPLKEKHYILPKQCWQTNFLENEIEDLHRYQKTRHVLQGQDERPSLYTLLNVKLSVCYLASDIWLCKDKRSPNLLLISGIRKKIKPHILSNPSFAILFCCSFTFFGNSFI